jgi:hypothetical protein
MTKPTKLLCGIAIAVVIAVAGYVVARSQNQQWRAATAGARRNRPARQGMR